MLLPPLNSLGARKTCSVSTGAVVVKTWRRSEQCRKQGTQRARLVKLLLC